MLSSIKSKKSKQQRHDVDDYNSRLPRSRAENEEGREQSLLHDEFASTNKTQDSSTSLSHYHSTMEVNNGSTKAKHIISCVCNACHLSGKKMETRSMVCQCCQTVYCRDCIGMSAKERTVVKDRNDIWWLCSSCIHNVKISWNMNVEQSKIEKFECQLTEMKQRILKLETDVQQKIDKAVSMEIAQKVVKESETVSLPSHTMVQTSSMPPLSTNHALQPNAIMDNYPSAQMTYADVAKMKKIAEQVIEDKSKTDKSVEERKLNILVFNMNESTKEMKEDKLREDIETFCDICKACDAPVPETDIVKLSRLGAPKHYGKPRALILTVKKEETKRLLFRNLYKLKETENTKYCNIAMNHDMTDAEKENNRKLLEEARRKRNEEPSENYTFVVRGPPWDRKILRIRQRPQLNMQQSIQKSTDMSTMTSQSYQAPTVIEA